MNSETKIRPGTRDAIIAGALSALGANPGASFSEIAIKAGVGRATLHRHFGTREALIDAIGQDCMDEMEEAVRALEHAGMKPLERLRSMFCAVVPLGDRYSFLQQAHTNNAQLKVRYVAQLKWLKDLVAELKADGVIAADLPESWVVSQIDQLIWTAWHAVQRGQLTIDNAAALAMRSLLHGLGERT